jgi:hypothetical protein
MDFRKWDGVSPWILDRGAETTDCHPGRDTGKLGGVSPWILELGGAEGSISHGRSPSSPIGTAGQGVRNQVFSQRHEGTKLLIKL